MDHGTFPVPPPATARLVTGVPVYGEGQGELLTPTGALLLTAHATEYGPLPPLTIEKTGHGAGTRETEGRPNVLRLIVGEEAQVSSEDRVLVLETELDDASPQLLGPLIEHLLDAGALDAYFTPVQMKKGRPGVLVTALAPHGPPGGGRGGPLPRDHHPRGATHRVGAHRSRARARRPSRPCTDRSVSRSVVGGERSTTSGPSSRTASEWRRRRRCRSKQVLAEALSAWRIGAGKQP